MKLQSDLEKEIFETQNRLRTNPLSFIPYLTKRQLDFDGKRIKLDNGTTLCTNEGADAVKEAIQAINETSKLEPL
jgi:hypothetical protein